VIQLSDVTRQFGPVSALTGVSLHVGEGEFVLLTGPSGAGKTTLLRTLIAAERPDEGQVVVLGKEVARLPRRAIAAIRRQIGVVFQDFKLLSDRTALDNVAVALQVRGLPPAQVRDRSLLALAAVGLEDRIRTKVASLSGGEQQRVAVARAMAGSPPILLCDEPTGNLDPERSHDILDLLELEARRGATVIVATHDPMVVQNAAACRVVLMDQGRVVGTLAGARATVTPPRRSEVPAPALGGLAPVEVAP
jgi:cell division transport system ATP-binding protein